MGVGSQPTCSRSAHVEIKELGHLVLYVRNLERSASFYRDVLGWRQILGGPDGSPLPFPAAAFSAPSGRTHHELLLIEVYTGMPAMMSARPTAA
jgi:catechol 2,3-dioxygenase